jgi:glycosyltransferase involved in cell wall biosynthesis
VSSRILVLETQTPFVHGGAEILVRQLAGALRERGYDADIVSIPSRDYPRGELLAGAAAWRLVDVTQTGGRPVDLVIATKFPNYCARHPRKVLWLTHQHRAAYELCGTPFSDFAHTERDVGLRGRLMALDHAMVHECTGRFTIAQTVSARLRKYLGVETEPVYHPPKLASRLRAGDYGSYMLTVTRLEHVKRVDLAIKTFLHVDPAIRLLIAGDGSVMGLLRSYIERLGLADRVTLLGRVDDEQLIALYAGARGVLFTPYDEDYGYVTLEAFLSRKPVVTTTDAGGPLEFVIDGVNGLVCDPDPGAIATAVNRLAADARDATRLGENGYDRARAITWEGVLERLVAAAISPRLEQASPA